MTFLGGVIVGTMLSGNRSYHADYIIRYKSWEEIWPSLLLLSILCFITIYIIALLVNRGMLKEPLQYGRSLSLHLFRFKGLQTANEYKITQIKDGIETLQEQPKFFLSPLWIAKWTLKNKINLKLVQLQNELIELEE